MKRFMAVYPGSAEGTTHGKAMDETRRKQSEKAGKEAWGKWGAANEVMECLPMPEM